jgi:hypothetical protein
MGKVVSPSTFSSSSPPRLPGARTSWTRLPRTVTSRPPTTHTPAVRTVSVRIRVGATSGNTPTPDTRFPVTEDASAFVRTIAPRR